MSRVTEITVHVAVSAQKDTVTQGTVGALGGVTGFRKTPAKVRWTRNTPGAEAPRRGPVYHPLASRYFLAPSSAFVTPPHTSFSTDAGVHSETT